MVGIDICGCQLVRVMWTASPLMTRWPEAGVWAMTVEARVIGSGVAGAAEGPGKLVWDMMRPLGVRGRCGRTPRSSALTM